MASLVIGGGCSTTASSTTASPALRDALTFHASFDGGTAADVGAGDRRLFHAPNMKQPRTGSPGLPAGGSVTLAVGQGRFGDALRFMKNAPEIVFFHVEKNIDFRTRDWSGTVSLWLKTDPAGDLAPGFCDPIQITPREWNDAAFFVEFEKKPDLIPFRLGAYGDLKSWNPRNRNWDAIPFEEKPLASVINPPFAGDRWTHVVFTFEGYNTGRKDGVTKLYLDGEVVTMLSPREQLFTWDVTQARIMLGVSYVGLFDEVSIFNRVLNDQEVRALHLLPTGVKGLR